jgi:hypothetical protein
MAGQIYDTTTLLGVMSQTKIITPFWLGFFPTQINFETEDIAFDRVNTDYRKLAPFVAPNVQGRVQGRAGYDTVSFKPAYVKPKDVVDPSMDIHRQPGETLGSGSLTNDQRRNAVIAEILKQHRTKLVNRNEWLAARALIDGAVTIQGEDYPAVTVNFRRHASLSYTLAGAAMWSAGTADPLADIKAAKLNANARSGVRLTKLVFGANAWEYFSARVNLKEMMNLNYAGSDTRVKLMSDGYEGQEYMGVIQGLDGGGKIEAWVDTSKYMDENGVEQFFLEQNTVVGVSDFIEGVRCFGAIRDVKAGLRPLEVFTKMWENEDPSVEYIMSQSAPLMVPKRPNASFKIRVHT